MSQVRAVKIAMAGLVIAGLAIALIPQKVAPTFRLAADEDATSAPIDANSPRTPQPGVSGVIPFLGSTNVKLRNLVQGTPEVPKPSRELPGPAQPVNVGRDASIQTTKAVKALYAAPAPYNGMTLAQNGAGWPPDTTGAIGPNYFIQAVNTSIGIYGRDGNLARDAQNNEVKPFRFNALFSSAGTNTPCDTSNQGDPVVVFDALSQRWIITDFAWSNLRSGPWYQCFAVSKTLDPVNGGWNFFGFQASTTAMNDYPKLGIWHDGIWMTANMFTNANSYSGAMVWVFNRDDLVSPTPTNIRYFKWNMGTSTFSLLPSNLADITASDTEYADWKSRPAFAVSSYGSTTRLSLWAFTAPWGATSAPTPVANNASVSSYVKTGSRVPQPSSSETLDSLGDRLMYPLQYRKGSLFVTQTVAPATGRFGIRWWQLSNLPTLSSSGTIQTSTIQVSQSTWAPDTSLERWMPSVAVNSLGDMAIIYNTSSKTKPTTTLNTYPSIRVAGRSAGNTTENLDIAEKLLAPGSGSQSGGYNRWGDYAFAGVDPSDHCTFWYTSEYYLDNSNNWRTAFGSFQISKCS